ncbi:MAG: lipid A deacylase LpxR family protein [Geovibrio sp.]|nr:lipid A deacylase LpxR family protein [Geovibrio sp.]
MGKTTGALLRCAAAFMAAVLLTAAPQKAFAWPDGPNGTLSFVIENDIFYSDQYYTNGVRASWTTAADKRPEWALNAPASSPSFRITPPCGQTTQ